MMELAFRSRGRTKLAEDGDKKHWYKKAVVPLIGEDLAYRKKQMFTVPVGEWFRTRSYDWLARTLQGSELVGRLFRPAQVQSMLERHRDGSANFTRELRALAALALWHEGVQAQGLGALE
jgi:asparagine synthase (glutamine-hydrolysing)